MEYLTKCPTSILGFGNGIQTQEFFLNCNYWHWVSRSIKEFLQMMRSNPTKSYYKKY